MIKLKDITTKCWILALFIRDDGERFLLGDGMYDFVDSQQHFQANEFANDVVEVQGNDGQLLAGQVRRSTPQSFDGYIGDATVSKTAIETARRAFFEFFRKNHHYEVVYVFKDGSAIKRQRGYIVDAPEVQELWQIHPKYHVALSFEDVNYYSYAELDDGTELFGKSVNLSVAGETSGGLVWDEDGVVWDNPNIIDYSVYGRSHQNSYSGKNLLLPQPSSSVSQGIRSSYDAETGIITLSGTASSTWSNPFVDFQVNLPAGTYTFSATTANQLGRNIIFYNGSTNIGERNLSATQESATFTTSSAATSVRLWITTVNGTNYNDVTFTAQLEAGSSATSFEPYVGGTTSPNPEYPQSIHTVTGVQTVSSNGASLTLNLGSIELCKLGDLQDYIYKDENDDWFIHKEIGKVVLNGSETYSQGGTATSGVYRMRTTVIASTVKRPSVGTNLGEACSSHFQIITANDTYDNIQGFGVETSGALVIYASNGITQTASAFTTWLSSNNVSIYYALATTTDTKITDATLISQLDAILDSGRIDGVTATGSNLTAIFNAQYGDGGGAIWDGDGSGSVNIIVVESLDNVAPVLKISGPIVDITVENITTNTAISFTGSITATQTLTIDSNSMTADINGTNVLPYISGEWLELRPGLNQIVVSVAESETDSIILEWQEIVG